MENLIKKLLNDINVELTEEFRKKSHRKSFFEDDTWQHPVRGKQVRTMFDYI